MGQNRRYGSDVTWAAVAESALRPVPLSLGRAEIGVDPASVPHADQSIAVRAWVPFAQANVHVEGRAVAWYGRTVCVQFTMRDATQYRAWVWSDAVERIQE